jgi:hypothetical protein
MADIYYEPGTNKNPIIQYAVLAEKLFPPEPKQKLMPFLGAGASLPRRSMPPAPAVAFALQDKIDAISDALGLTKPSRARLFVDLAVRLATVIQAQEQSSVDTVLDAHTAFIRARDSRFPPAADDLADVLAKLCSYDTFERPRQKLRSLLAANDSDLVEVLRWIALLTDITRPTAPLLSVSSYYEYSNPRKDLWDKLQQLFANKRWPTATNFLVARAAWWHLRADKPSLKDYLIITTNYDCLVEVALDLFKVPYCVLTVDRTNRKVYTRFSSGVQQYLGYGDQDYQEFQNELNGQNYPANFTLEKNRAIAVIYKIHGCLFPTYSNADSIVLSDEDYIDYLCRLFDNNGMIPGAVTKLMLGKGFLFMGYSFSDWNVRGIYKTLLEKRAGAEHSQIALGAAGAAQPGVRVQDYAVVKDLNVYESAFFRQRNITLLETDLYRFGREMRLEGRKWMQSCNAR